MLFCLASGLGGIVPCLKSSSKEADQGPALPGRKGTRSHVPMIAQSKQPSDSSSHAHGAMSGTLRYTTPRPIHAAQGAYQDPTD